MSSTTEESRTSLRRFIRLDKLKRALKADLDKVKADLDALEPVVLRYMERNKMQKATVDGLTAYIKRELWAKRPPDVTTEEMCAGLKACGREAFVKEVANMQTLSGWIRELDHDKTNPEDELELPTEMQGLLEVSETFRVRTRTAN